jgi:hypothetical protein
MNDPRPLPPKAQVMSKLAEQLAGEVFETQWANLKAMNAIDNVLELICKAIENANLRLTDRARVLGIIRRLMRDGVPQ